MMIRLFFLGVVLLPLFGIAQDKKNVQLDIGFSAGYSESEFFGSHVDNRKDIDQGSYWVGNNAFAASVQMKLTVKQYFFFRNYITYVQKGGEEKDSGFTYPVNAKLNYLSIPLMLGFQPINFSNMEWLNVYIEGGMVPNFLVKLTSDDIKKGYGEEPEITNFVWACQVGAGAEVKITDKVKLYGNYSFSKDTKHFFEVYNNKDFRLFNKSSMIHFGVMLTLH